MITAEVLDEKIKLLEGQRETNFATYHQAVGAIGICQHLKELLTAKDHLTTEELGKALGGTVESIDPL